MTDFRQTCYVGSGGTSTTHVALSTYAPQRQPMLYIVNIVSA